MSEAPWMTLLRETVEARGLGYVSERTEYSKTVLSRVLRNQYRGSLDAVEKAVLGGLTGRSVTCPVLGDIPQQVCITNQRASFAATNPARVRLYHACRECPNRLAAPAGRAEHNPTRN